MAWCASTVECPTRLPGTYIRRDVAAPSVLPKREERPACSLFEKIFTHEGTIPNSGLALARAVQEIQ